MKEQVLTFASGISNPVTASMEQSAYLDSGNYTIPFADGRTFTRSTKQLAFNPMSGKILVKEEIFCGNHNYHKTFVISRDGKPEKYKGDNF